jgi:Kef-type K+ transport system membrane component KefB
MDEAAKVLFAIGVILLLAIAAEFLGRRTFLPRVTLLLLLGILLGREAWQFIPQALSGRFDLLPQAGVAISTGLVTVSEFARYRELILPVIIGSTVVFEIVGPILTRHALKRSSEGIEA